MPTDTSAAGDSPRIVITRAPGILFEGDWVKVLVQVDPHADNRGFWLLAVDGEAIVRRSLTQLEGDRAARSWWIDWKTGLPAGELELVAVLVTKDGLGPRDRRALQVLSRLP